ncbi:MAG: hypothetical protein LBM77_05355 [Spirochaetaceae bacterium]|jgi:hypothetical protein|nr:hypothetical protein [Spirochaetaceae bacterium]
MKRTKLLGLAAVVAVVVSAALFASCSTFPTVGVTQGGMNYELLGYIGDGYASYAAALEAGKAKYPDCEAVVKLTGTTNDNIIPGSIVYGYYAAKFKEGEGGAAGGILGKVF